MIKNDAHEIINHLSFLKKESWLQGSREWWPSYLYHTTCLENAVKILDSNELHSRTSAQQNNLISYDIADQTVIAGTSDHDKDFVRFYFRPRTPTLFNNEGFRPTNAIIHQAHCPIPICFLFDANTLLSRSDCQFTNGNLGSPKAQCGTDATFFKNLPFEFIYHDGSFYPEQKDQIIFHRNAEANIPKMIDLSSLCYIACRSEAERETLLDQMSSTAFIKWHKHIRVFTSYLLFNERWNFIRNVQWDKKTLKISFNLTLPQNSGPFNFSWGVSKIEDDLMHNCPVQTNSYISTLTGQTGLMTIDLGPSFSNSSINFWVLLNNRIAYKNRFYCSDDFPF